MARAISDEELQLKRRARRRLIGAIVLVAAIVVVLPMVLDSEPKPSDQVVSVQIPSPDSGRFTSKVVPLAGGPVGTPAPPADTATKPVPEPATKPVEPPAAAAPEPPATTAAADSAKEPPPAAKAVAGKPEKPAIPKTAPAAAPAARPDGNYVVQVIALADAGKAKQMQESIAAAGIRSYTEVVKTAKGDVTRVRAGPFATRAAAEKAREQLKSLGMNGNITTR
jgi:DedD protein